MSFALRVNLLILGAGLALCLMGLLQAVSNRVLTRATRRLFVTFFAVAVVSVLGNLMAEVTTGEPEWRILTKSGMFLQSVFSAVLPILLTVLLLYLTDEKRWWLHPLFVAVVALWIVYMGLLVYTQFSTVIYYYDETNIYHRGPLYPLLLVPPILIMDINMVGLLRRWKQLTPNMQRAFLVYLLTPLVAMLIQIRFFGVMTVVLGTTMAAFYMFATTLREQSDQFYRQEQENVQLKMDIMLTQIQPHFLYNTLGAIQSQCRTDPALAEKAVIQFSQYLRGNMDSLSQSGAIPFERELQHTMLYLELEKLRYEDALQVVYDLEARDFFLPTLTLQPLVENAVRHGVRRNPDGRGTVTIRSRAYADRIEVTVADNGPGFDPNDPPRDNRSHFGIDNVRERLRHVSNGTLSIVSSPGGTQAMIVLPKGG